MQKKTKNTKKKDITYKRFMDCLAKRGIGPVSNYVPTDLLNSKTFHAPSPEDLIDVSEESFPFHEKSQVSNFYNDIKQEYCQLQLHTIAIEPPNMIDYDTIGTAIEMPEEFSSPEEYLAFKLDIASQYLKFSKDNHLNPPIQICTFPLCTNACPPTFRYCINHLNHDPNFQAQHFIGSCNQVFDGKVCSRPCGIGKNVCSLHENVK